MSEETVQAIIIALFAAIPPTLAGLGALRQGQRNGQTAEEVSKKTDEIKQHAETAVVKTEEVQKQADKIQLQTDGRFSELILTIHGLTSEVAAERALREQREKELSYSLAVLSARFGKPIATIRAMVRAEDFGEMPGQWLGDDPPPKRRRVDKIKRTNGDRYEDKS